MIKRDAIKEHIEGINTPIFERVLQEKISNSMTTPPIPPIKKLWRPNNFRRRIKVFSKTNKLLCEMERAISTLPMEINPHTKVVTVKFKEVTLQYGKDCLMGMWSQPKVNGKKLEFLIEGKCFDDIESFVIKKKNEIRIKIDAAFNLFCNMFKIGIGSTPEWFRAEDGYKGDEYLDAIPQNIFFHGDHIKKVYASVCEFKTNEGEEPTIKMLNYIENRAIERVSPEISKELGLLRVAVNPLIFLKQNILCVDDVFKFPDIVSCLSDIDKLDFSNWMIENEGGLI